MTEKRRCAFTFIELCVSVGIIAILAAILFPVFAKAREKARQTMCVSNLGQIGLALRMYAADNYGHFPPGDNDLAALAPRYLPDENVFECPSAPGLGYPPPPDGQHYVYRGGLAIDDDPMTSLAADVNESVHNEGFNGLAVDGHVRWNKGGQYSDDRYAPFRRLVPPPSPPGLPPP